VAHADLADDGGIVVTTVWSEKDALKQIPGTRWHAATKTWRLPLTWASCVALRGVFGAQLTISEKLNLWAFNERKTRVDPALALRNALEVPLDGMDPRLYPFQRAGVEFLLTAGSALLGDEMGTGKTVQILTALRRAHLAAGRSIHYVPVLPALIVCPNSVKLHWARHVPTWFPEATPYVVEGGAGARRKILAAAKDDPAALIIINLETLRLFSRLAPYGSVKLKRCRECDPKYGDESLKPSTCHVHAKELNLMEFRTLVLDEAHRIKDPHSQQTRAAWALAQQPTVMTRYALTGTPIVQSPDDLWSIMHVVAPEEYPVRSPFIDRYCLQSWNAHGGIEVVGTRPDTRQELFAFFDPRFRRTLKAQVLKNLPPKVRETRWVDMEAGQARMYRELHDQLYTRTPEGELFVAPDRLSATIRLVQLASSSVAVEKPDPDDVTSWVITLRNPSSKLDALEEVLEELGDARCVIAAEHRQLIELASARLAKLGISHLLITGEVAPHDREVALAALNEGRIRCLLFTVKAGGVGLDMSSVDTLINLQRSWSVADSKQTEDRVHRIGSERHQVVRIIDIITRNTVEETQVERLYEKLARLDEITRDREKLRAAGQSTAALDAEEAALLQTNLLAPDTEAA
jgi:SNF2 family DNA or RNA helicase